jgi:hypothetical protein
MLPASGPHHQHPLFLYGHNSLQCFSTLNGQRRKYALDLYKITKKMFPEKTKDMEKSGF